MPISLLPGPSELTAQTRDYLHEIVDSGLLSQSHRSEAFKEVCRSAVTGLKHSMRIPEDYRVLFTSSATAAMSASLRSLVHKRCHHFVHGAFAARFHAMALGLGLRASVTDTDPKKALAWRQSKLDPACEVLCLTHNETSTGSMWPSSEIAELRALYPAPLLVIDATSSLGAMAMDWNLADLWFCSVQKCLGLPAGLGILLVGPRALAVAGHLAEVPRPHLPCLSESLAEMARRMEDAQTLETPNVLAIALLARQMESWDLDEIEEETREKAAFLAEASLGEGFYVEEPAWQSLSVHNFRFAAPDLVRRKALEGGFLLGKGYGRLADSCLRIANFPASTTEQIRDLVHVIGR